MTEDNCTGRGVRTRDSLTTQHLREAVQRDIEGMLAAESLTTAHLQQTLQPAQGQGVQVKPQDAPISRKTAEDK